MTDPLDPIRIAARQREIEAALQPIPAQLLAADEDVADALYDLNLAKARAAAELSGEKMVAAERELRIFEMTSDVWKRWQHAKIRADYARASYKALSEELISLMSLAKAAARADDAHGRFGDG